MLLQLDKKTQENQQLRLKYAEEPLKYLDSEVSIVEILDTLHLLAASPSLYPSFISQDGLTKVLELVTHENTDVGRSCTSLLLELIEDIPLEGDISSSSSKVSFFGVFYALVSMHLLCLFFF